MKFRISNITATSSILGRFDWPALVFLKNVRPTRQTSTRSFRSLVWKLTGVTALVYESGSVVFVGAKSSETIRAAIEEISETLGVPCTIPVVSNYVITSKNAARFSPAHLTRFLATYNETGFVQYEPELFQAVLWQPRGHLFKVNFFHSGTVNVTGLRLVDELEEAVHIVTRLLAVYPNPRICSPLAKQPHSVLDLTPEHITVYCDPTQTNGFFCSNAASSSAREHAGPELPPTAADHT